MGVETALMVGSLVGTAISAFGQYKEGQDAAEASRYNASVTRQNAATQASMVEQSGALEASQQRRSTQRVVSSQRARYGASGVELTGSPLNVMIGTSAEGELDARIIEYNTKVKSSQILSQAASQATYDEQLAKRYERSGLTNMGSTLLTSGSKFATSYLSTGSSSSGQVYKGGKVKTGDYSMYSPY